MSLFDSVTIGQYVPGRSFVHRLDPRVKILVLFFYIVMIFMAKTWLHYLVVTAFIGFIIILSRIKLKFVLAGMKPILWIVGLTAILHLTTTKGGELLFHWGFLTIYETGLKLAVEMSVRLILLIAATSMLTLSTSPIDLTDGMERFFRPFQRIGLPAHEMALMISIALRFIPIFIDEMEKIMKAQQSRGANFDTGPVLKRVNALVPVLIPLFVSAFRRADELALAMEARCYHGGEGRTKLRILRLSWRDGVAVAVFAALFLLVLPLPW